MPDGEAAGAQWECPRCGMVLAGEGAGPGKPHGWPKKTDPVEIDKETGAEIWRFVRCADATDGQVAAYREAKAEIARRSGRGG